MQIRSHDELAINYNDQSPLENHHCASGFKLLNQHKYNFLSRAKAHVFDAVRCATALPRIRCTCSVSGALHCCPCALDHQACIINVIAQGA